MEIKELKDKLQSKFKRIWRCADSNKWYILKKSDLLTFDWIDKNTNYKSLSANDIGSGKRAIYPFVNSLKIGDLIFVMGKNSFQGIAICESEYQFNGLTLNMGDSGDKPAVEVHYIFKSENSVNHNLETHNNPTTFADINQYNFGLENVLTFLKNTLPEAYASMVNSVNSSKTNYKQQYTTWLNSTNKEGSKKAGSYIRALDILSEITNENIFEIDNLSTLNALYDDLLIEQEKTDGKYFYEQAPSYGVSRFYSASIKSYSEFIKQLSQPQTELQNTQTNMALNQILFGPPGTGKTYNSIDKSVAIATGSSADHYSNKIIFDDLRKQGQIEFVTFHQNYSYEDFMVGIRPNVNETTSELSFKKHYGIFYEIAKRARENYENSLKDEQTISLENWVNEKFEEFINSIRNTLENGNDYRIGTKFLERKVLSIVDDIYYQQGGEKVVARHMDFNDIIYAYLDNTFENKDIQNNSRLTNTARNPGLTQYYVDILKQFKDFAGVYKGQSDAETDINTKCKNFVLIIDEINRANISKVFGELITLLEDDKRIGEPNELKITLPNGEKEFGVPPNLYLIGTMNTADKSIALIDIALRRRFEFIGKYPDYDEIKNVDSKNLLQKINEEIYKLKNSADYLIGHAYFMKGQSIEETLSNKIVPLLMEYFSGKTKIVADIFIDTNWKVEYDTTKFNWTISTR